MVFGILVTRRKMREELLKPPKKTPAELEEFEKRGEIAKRLGLEIKNESSRFRFSLVVST